MATKNASDLNSKPLFSADEGNQGIYYGKVTDTPATGDVWRLCKLPAGMKVLRVSLANDDLGTAAPGDVGYAPIDGSTGDADAFVAANAFGTASTGTVKLLADAPVDVPEDSYLTVTFGTVTTATSGTIQVIVEGELFGAK